eukprot:Gb_34026 [translate_table: standard]
MAKKRSGGGGSSKMNKKKIRTSAPETVAMKGKPNSKQNLFETLWNRKKFEILGKKQKGQGRRMGLARSQAIEKRKKTLLQEYKQSGKANSFLDRRFGENDDTFGDADKAIIRFQHERQARLHRKSKYTLSDGEDDILTHHGAALSTLDDFEDEIPQDDEDGVVELDDTITRKLNFGGGSSQNTHSNAAMLEEDEHKHKSKKEVMEEIIAKSKFYKAQKVKEKEEDENLMEKLDRDFTSLAQSEGLLSLVRPKKETWKALLSKKGSKGITSKGDSNFAEKALSEKDQSDDYDKLVKEMVLDIRARASDRTKTPEEIAQEDRARLESLEEERKKRMLGNEDSDDEENDENGSKTRVPKRMKVLSGDDLGDSFFSDEETDKKGWVDEVLERRENDSEEGESDDDASSEEIEGDEDDSQTEEPLLEQDWEQSDDDDNDVDKLGQEIFDEAGEEALKKQQKDTKIRNLNSEKAVQKNAAAQKPIAVDKVESLPFVINAPSNLRELRLLLDNRSDSEIIEAIHRIRTCNAISLAAENRNKMQVFYGVLLQYFAVLADEKPFCLNKTNLLVRPLMEMSLETPYFAAICARQRLVRIRNQLSEDLKNPEKNSSWPSLKTLLLLRLWSLIFPSSDFRHVVMTPVVLLMSEYLMRCPVNSGRDIAIGTFLCAMLLSVNGQARRFCPEALNFLQALLLSAVDIKKSSNMKAYLKCPVFLLELIGSRPWLHLSSSIAVLPEPLNFTMVMEAADNSPHFDSNTYRVGVLLSVTETLVGFVNMYQDIVSFPEVFFPFVPLLHEVANEEAMPKSLQDRMTGVAHLIKEKIDEHEMLRQPLRMRMQKPAPIKQFNPKFEENFVHGRDYDPDRERAERKKLQRQIKREAKGAARELRKDNYFLHEVKARERALAEEEKAEKYRKAMSFLQEQESAFKSGQLGKGRKKRK